MTEPTNTLLILVLTALTAILSLLLIRKTRHAKRLTNEIQGVSAERNGLRQEISELLQWSHSAHHKPQAPLYAAMHGAHPRHTGRRSIHAPRARASASIHKPNW